MSDYDRFESIFCGTWQYEGQENLNAFLDARGIPEEERMDHQAPSSVTYTRIWSSVKSSMQFGAENVEGVASFGKQLEFKDSQDNPKHHGKITSTMTGDTVHQDIESVKRGDRYTNVLSVDGDHLFHTMSCKGVTMKRIYKRV